MKGKFIVIDGTDGAGKATQARLLAVRLRNAGKQVFLQDFPRYGKKSAALVEDYLNGRFGQALELGPYIPSIFYAVDRFAASADIRKALKQGKTVVSNRYVTANQAHQGSKLKSRKARSQFFDWAESLEYGLFKLPKPDLVVILHVPAKTAQQLVAKKGERKYLKRFKKRDLHERDLSHLRAAERTYLELSKRHKLRLVECARKGQMLSRQAIADLVWGEIKKIL